LALTLSPLVSVRPGELRKAEREHFFDLEQAEWRIPRAGEGVVLPDQEQLHAQIDCAHRRHASH
jgi:hypothetical protein